MTDKQGNQYKIKRFSFCTYGEILAVTVFFLVLWFFLTRYAGGPIYSDEAMYINHGLMGVKDPFVLNRYTHIFFQRLFTALANTPLEGVRAFWGFLVAGSAVFTYTISRLATKASNPIQAVISTLLYLSIPLLAVYSGNTAVDITAGFFVSLLVLIFMFYFRNPKQPAILLGLMGFIFFLAFRTKETTLVSAILLIGFLFDETGKISFRVFLRRMALFLLGVMAGVVLFILLNGVLLGDPWFGLRINDFTRFTGSYVEGNITGEAKPVANWFSDYLFTETLHIFMAFVLSSVVIFRQQKLPMRLPWLVPLMLIALLSLIIGFSSWGVVPRHIFPVLPLICAFAPQLIVFDPPKTKKEWLWLVLSMCFGALLFFISRRLLVKASLLGPYYYPDFLASTVYPITLIALISLVLFFKKFSVKTIILPIMLFAIFIAYPLYYNGVQFFLVQTNVRKMNERLLVIEAFNNQFESSKETRILVFEDALYYMNDSSRHAEFISLFNIYFDARLTTDEVKMTTRDLFTPNMLAEWQPNFILMSAADYESTVVNKYLMSLGSADVEHMRSSDQHFMLFSRGD